MFRLTHLTKEPKRMMGEKKNCTRKHRNEWNEIRRTLTKIALIFTQLSTHHSHIKVIDFSSVSNSPYRWRTATEGTPRYYSYEFCEWNEHAYTIESIFPAASSFFFMLQHDDSNRLFTILSILLLAFSIALFCGIYSFVALHLSSHHNGCHSHCENWKLQCMGIN